MSTNYHAAILHIALGVLIFTLFLVIVALYLQPKGEPTCSSFGSHADMVASFNAGNTRLDRNHNGKPCQDYIYGN